MRGVIEIDAKYANRILPYIGGEEVNNDPRQHPHRYVFNLSDLDERTARKEWPLLLKIAEDRVKPQRSEVKRDIYRSRWWRFAEPQNALYKAIGRKEHVLAMNCGATPHVAFARLTAGSIYANTLAVLIFDQLAPLAVLQSRLHEVWGEVSRIIHEG